MPEGDEATACHGRHDGCGSAASAGKTRRDSPKKRSLDPRFVVAMADRPD
jgi:hypothetical protein